MKRLLYLFLFISSVAWAQQTDNYENKVLDATEIEFLGSYYKQDGKHAAVNGGMGSESLDNKTGNIVVSIPLNSQDVLTVDAGFSAYTSASSSNINPFMQTFIAVQESNNDSHTGASRPYGRKFANTAEKITHKKVHYGSPWITSTGASRSDVLYSGNVAYKHTSEDQNMVWEVNSSFSTEYDYQSFGFGGGLARLWNDKNSEIGIKASVFLDKWKIIYPTELHEYGQYKQDFQNMGHFYAVDIFNQVGQKSKQYLPLNFKEFNDNERNSYRFSLTFSQVLSPKSQLSIMADALFQEGLLSTPYHRIYFADRENYFIGNPSKIPVYNKDSNDEVYQLADDVERLPSTRIKFPIGLRFHQYINYFLVLKTYYRYYIDDWGLDGHTLQVEAPIKITPTLTFSPMYRFYHQNQVNYFAPFDTHYSYQKYYTSDYDLSTFSSHQWGASLRYYDALTSLQFFGIGFKSAEIRYQKYWRTDFLSADIISFSMKFIL